VSKVDRLSLFFIDLVKNVVLWGVTSDKPSASKGQRMEETDYSEMLVTVYKTTLQFDEYRLLECGTVCLLQIDVSEERVGW
jgi:hypothetical protein